MARSAARGLLCFPLIMLLLGCSVEKQTQRIGRLYDAVRSQPQVQPPADYVSSPPAVISTDPIAKADVVVFATRPGDAIVSTYATISQAKQEGKRVVIVYVTNGDAQTGVAQALAELPANATPTSSQYLQGAKVLQELAIQVARSTLGLETEDVIFLSYPDGAVHELTEDMPERVIRSQFTEKDGLFDTGIPPYRLARSGKSVSYTFNAILHDLNDVLVELNPKEIYFPSPASTDVTVAAAGRLIARSLREVAPRDARAFVYYQQPNGQPSPDRRISVANPAAKQGALDMYAARIGSAGPPSIAAALLEAEEFWVYD